MPADRPSWPAALGRAPRWEVAADRVRSVSASVADVGRKLLHRLGELARALGGAAVEDRRSARRARRHGSSERPRRDSRAAGVGRSPQQGVQADPGMDLAAIAIGLQGRGLQGRHDMDGFAAGAVEGPGELGRLQGKALCPAGKVLPIGADVVACRLRREVPGRAGPTRQVRASWHPARRSTAATWQPRARCSGPVSGRFGWSSTA